jgi:hypothetical protein
MGVQDGLSCHFPAVHADVEPVGFVLVFQKRFDLPH